MFNNAHHALVWSYETITREIVNISSANDMRQNPTRGMQNALLIGLGVQDLHKQAAQIIGMVDRLTSQESREYLNAEFGRKMKQGDIRSLIYSGCDVSGLGLSQEVPVYRIIKEYFNGNMPYRKVRKILCCSSGYALAIKTCLYNEMDHIHHRAIADITEVLEDHGLIQSRYNQAPCVSPR